LTGRDIQTAARYSAGPTSATSGTCHPVPVGRTVTLGLFWPSMRSDTHVPWHPVSTIAINKAATTIVTFRAFIGHSFLLVVWHRNMFHSFELAKDTFTVCSPQTCPFVRLFWSYTTNLVSLVLSVNRKKSFFLKKVSMEPLFQEKRRVSQRKGGPAIVLQASKPVRDTGHIMLSTRQERLHYGNNSTPSPSMNAFTMA
jgi:hypothetical protein